MASVRYFISAARRVSDSVLHTSHFPPVLSLVLCSLPVYQLLCCCGLIPGWKQLRVGKVALVFWGRQPITAGKAWWQEGACSDLSRSRCRERGMLAFSSPPLYHPVRQPVRRRRWHPWHVLPSTPSVDLRWRHPHGHAALTPWSFLDLIKN